MSEEQEEVTFTKNKRLIEKADGSHVGGSLGPSKDDNDGINNIRLNKRGMLLSE